MHIDSKVLPSIVDSVYFFALMQKSNKKDQGCIKKPKNLNVCLK